LRRLKGRKEVESDDMTLVGVWVGRILRLKLKKSMDGRSCGFRGNMHQYGGVLGQISVGYRTTSSKCLCMVQNSEVYVLPHGQFPPVAIAPNQVLRFFFAPFAPQEHFTQLSISKILNALESIFNNPLPVCITFVQHLARRT